MSAQWLRPYGQNCDNDHNVVHLKDKTCFAMFHWHEKKEEKRKEKAWLCHQKILKCTNLELSFFSASGPAQIVCLITETHSHCAGEAAPHQHIITASQTWIIIMCVCVCVIEIEKAVVFKRNTGIISERLHEQTKGPVFAWPQQLPLLPYLSPSCSFSLEDADSVEQSERSWLNSLTNLKRKPLFGSNASLFSLFWRWTWWQLHINGSVCTWLFGEKELMCADVCNCVRLGA